MRFCRHMDEPRYINLSTFLDVWQWWHCMIPVTLRISHQLMRLMVKLIVKAPLAKTSQRSTSSCKRKKHVQVERGARADVESSLTGWKKPCCSCFGCAHIAAVAYSLHRTREIVYQRLPAALRVVVKLYFAFKIKVVTFEMCWSVNAQLLLWRQTWCISSFRCTFSSFTTACLVVSECLQTSQCVQCASCGWSQQSASAQSNHGESWQCFCRSTSLRPVDLNVRQRFRQSAFLIKHSWFCVQGEV